MVSDEALTPSSSQPKGPLHVPTGSAGHPHQPTVNCVEPLYAGLTGAAIYSLSASNFLFVLSYAGGTTGNFVNGMVAGAAAFVVGGVAMYILGFPKLVSPSTDNLTDSDLAISR